MPVTEISHFYHEHFQRLRVRQYSDDGPARFNTGWLYTWTDRRHRWWYIPYYPSSFFLGLVPQKTMGKILGIIILAATVFLARKIILPVQAG